MWAALVVALLTTIAALGGYVHWRGIRVDRATPEYYGTLVIDPLTEAELSLGQLDHGAESLAVNGDLLDEYHALHREETARQFWNASFDWYIDNINKQFDDLVSGMPSTDSDPFDRGYWPVVSAVPVSVAPVSGAAWYDRLAEFSPDATIEIITDTDAPPWASWMTQEHITVPGSVQVAHHGAKTLVRMRPRAKHARRWRS